MLRRRLFHRTSQEARGETGPSEIDGIIAARRLISFTENVYSASSLVNLMMFLRFGQYRSLPERLLGARLVYTEPNMSRIVSFEYLNRQLVWQELSVRIPTGNVPMALLESMRKALDDNHYKCFFLPERVL